MGDREKIEAFKEIYSDEIGSKEGVKEIKFSGSTEDSCRWISGKSDLDIFIYGWNIPSKVKVQGILLIEKLNYELNLKLEKVIAGHPTTIYIDSPQRYIAVSLIFNLKPITDPARAIAKGIWNRNFYPFNYRFIWDLTKKINELDKKNLPLPISKFL